MHPLVCGAVGRVEATPAKFAATVAEVVGGERARAIERSGRSWHFAKRLQEGLAAAQLGATSAFAGHEVPKSRFGGRRGRLKSRGVRAVRRPRAHSPPTGSAWGG